jgi:hypothetical protein
LLQPDAEATESRAKHIFADQHSPSPDENSTDHQIATDPGCELAGQLLELASHPEPVDAAIVIDPQLPSSMK